MMADNQQIPYEGHQYCDNPRMRGLIEAANQIKDSLLPAGEDYTRLWRGNRPGEVGKNPSFTSSLVGIALPFLEGYGGDLSYVDVPTAALRRYECKTGAAAGAEFMLSAELASRAKIVERTVVQAALALAAGSPILAPLTPNPNSGGTDNPIAPTKPAAEHVSSRNLIAISS